MKTLDYSPDVLGLLRSRNCTPADRLVVLALAAIRCWSTTELIHDITQLPKSHIRTTVSRLVDEGIIDRVNVAASIASDEEVPLFQLACDGWSAGYFLDFTNHPLPDPDRECKNWLDIIGVPDARSRLDYAPKQETGFRGFKSVFARDCALVYLRSLFNPAAFQLLRSEYAVEVHYPAKGELKGSMATRIELRPCIRIHRVNFWDQLEVVPEYLISFPERMCYVEDSDADDDGQGEEELEEESCVNAEGAISH
jgi:hypothetical protein